MGNPPDWAKRSKHTAPFSEVYIMAGIQVGAVGAADVNSQPAQTGALSLQSPAAWSMIWFGLSTLYLLGVYYGMISIRRGH